MRGDGSSRKRRIRMLHEHEQLQLPDGWNMISQKFLRRERHLRSSSIFLLHFGFLKQTIPC